MKTVLYTLCVLSFNLLHAQNQELELTKYDWEPNPTLTTLNSDDAKKDLVNTTTSRFVEYAYKEDKLAEYTLIHKRKLLNSEEAVEANNRVYIPVYDENNYLVAKARVILKDGTIKEQNESNIKNGFDEETEREYNYFAFEGIEVGSEIEYFYIIEKSPSYSGSSFIVQDESLSLNNRFEIISPGNLTFETKGINGIPEMQVDTAIEEKNRLFISIDTIVGLEDEPSAYHSPNLGRILYKLDNNYYTGKTNIFSYSYVAQNIYNNYAKELERQEEKAIKKIAKAISKQEGINIFRKIEDYIKSEYTYINANAEPLYMLDDIYDNKVYNQSGAIKMYKALFSSFDVQATLVFTTNRNTHRFYPDFESYLSIQEPLFYIPALGEYLDPTDQFSRIGLVNPNYRFNKALFIESIDMGEFKTAVAEVKEIKELDGSFTVDTLVLNVDFENNPTNHLIDIYRSISGYNARNLQPLYQYIDEENKKDFDESMLTWIDEEADVVSVELLNMEANLLGVKPMVVKGSITLDKVIEKAGPKYLFKVGTLIGPQMEMYKDDDEENRQLDIEVPYGRTYYRTMTFNIPEGYQVSNLEALKIDKHYTTVSDNEIYFISDYSVDGNVVTIKIDEFYERCLYPKERFEEYRDIINAAADFNKVVLVFEKEG